MHKAQEELSNNIALAKTKVKVGALYYHYKNPKLLYKVIHVAITEYNDEVCIVYEAQYGDNIVFVRPLTSWLQHTKTGKSSVQRFTSKPKVILKSLNK